MRGQSSASAPVETTDLDLWEPKSPRLPLVAQLRERVLDRTGAWLSERGVRRIALYGAGKHTRAVIRQPWLLHGIDVVAIIDDDPRRESIVGVPVVTLAEAMSCELEFQAVVLSSTEFEDQMGERAARALRGTGIEIVRLYTPDDVLWEASVTERRLVGRGLSPSEAKWLVANRGERHDALLPIIPPARTELHARRYELAAEVLRSMDVDRASVADIACGTGYGSGLLARISGADRVIGVDLDAEAIAYANRRHKARGVDFLVGDATATGISDGSMDLVASFETIEHLNAAAALVEEFHRVLRPGGLLVISTPNRIGPTPYHAHDFGFIEFRDLLDSHFEIPHWIGQLPIDDVHEADLPPGMWRLDPDLAASEDWRRAGRGGRPDFLIAVCRKPGRGSARAGASDAVDHATPFGAIHAPMPTRDPRALYEWLSGAERDSVLWDAAPDGGLLALAAARSRRFASILALEPSPREHWRLTETLRANGIDDVRACCASLLGQQCPGALAGPITSLASLVGVPMPQYLRFAVDSASHIAALAGQLDGVSSVWIDLGEGAQTDAIVAALRACGFRIGDHSEGALVVVRS